MFYFRNNRHVIAAVLSVLLMIVVVTVFFIQVKHMFEELGRTQNNTVAKYMRSCFFVVALLFQYMINNIQSFYGKQYIQT